MNKSFESYWKNEGQFLDYVNKNFNKEAELKEFARQIFKFNANKIDDLETTIAELNTEIENNKKYCNCE